MVYIPELGPYDFDGDGRPDVYFYKGATPSIPSGVLARKVDEEIFF